MDARPDPAEAAARIADERYPDADLVILAGSVTTGRATPTSDLDLVVVSIADDEAPFRESFVALGWPVEAFVHTPDSLRGFMRKGVAERERSMPRMVSTGWVIRDRADLAAGLRDEAQAMISAGPPPHDDQTLAFLRYHVTDLLDDLRGDPDGEESRFVADDLVRGTAELFFAMAGAWTGGGKWLLRELREADPGFADDVVAALRAHGGGDAGPLITLVERVLAAGGGPLFDGYRASGRELLREFLEREGQA
jgi:hypothetical protein